MNHTRSLRVMCVKTVRRNLTSLLMIISHMRTNMKRTKVFAWHYPGMGYCANWYDYCNINEAKKQIREYMGVKKLPNGFAIWLWKG